MIHYGGTINIFIINNSNVLYWLHQLRISCMFIKICSTPIQASDLDILASSYVSAETYPRVHISFPLTSGSIVRKRRQWRVGRGNVSRRSLRLSVEYVGSLRVVVTSDGHTMLISFEIFNQIDLSIELLSIPVDYVKF